MVRRVGRGFISRFERFYRSEAAGGILLLGATVAALAWANSPFAGAYDRVWGFKTGFALGPLVLHKPVLLWINDGLMAVFFLLVGLEVKRELVVGELSNPRSAALPIVAAFGGMVVPALLYVVVTRGTDVAAGWGIPMATDIAFALGALAILRKRLPPVLAVFLAASAIVDDIGAVLVIALVYTPSLALGPFAVAVAACVALLVLNRAGVRRILPYALVGVVLWVGLLKSGVHATLAGVLVAFAIPASGTPGTASPLERLEHRLLPWVSFGIVPLFALANAGVRVDAALVSGLGAPVAVGILLGLVVGKQIGLLVAPWLAVRAGMATLPAGVTWRHVWGLGWLAGIGFTMSLFITGLALPDEELARAKFAILVASSIAAAGGLLVLGTAKPATTAPTGR